MSEIIEINGVKFKATKVERPTVPGLYIDRCNWERWIRQTDIDDQRNYQGSGPYCLLLPEHVKPETYCGYEVLERFDSEPEGGLPVGAYLDCHEELWNLPVEKGYIDEGNYPMRLICRPEAEPRSVIYQDCLCSEITSDPAKISEGEWVNRRGVVHAWTRNSLAWKINQPWGKVIRKATPEEIEQDRLAKEPQPEPQALGGNPLPESLDRLTKLEESGKTLLESSERQLGWIEKLEREQSAATLRINAIAGNLEKLEPRLEAIEKRNARCDLIAAEKERQYTAETERVQEENKDWFNQWNDLQSKWQAIQAEFATLRADLIARQAEVRADVEALKAPQPTIIREKIMDTIGVHGIVGIEARNLTDAIIAAMKGGV